MGDVNNAESRACVGAGGVWEICLPSAQFCYEPKTALKIKSILKKRYIAQVVDGLTKCVSGTLRKII